MSIAVSWPRGVGSRRVLLRTASVALVLGSWLTFGRLDGFTAPDPQLYGDLLALSNADRTSNGMPALPVDERLRGVAQDRSTDMQSRNYFAHEIPPNGDLVFSLLRARGLSYEGAAENIGQFTGPRVNAAHDLQHAFLDSAGHRANLLDGRWTVIGIGADGSAVSGPASSPSHSVVTVLFMRPVGGVAEIDPSLAAAPDLGGDSAPLGDADLFESTVDDALSRSLGIGGN